MSDCLIFAAWTRAFQNSNALLVPNDYTIMGSPCLYTSSSNALVSFLLEQIPRHQCTWSRKTNGAFDPGKHNMLARHSNDMRLAIYAGNAQVGEGHSQSRSPLSEK